MRRRPTLQHPATVLAAHPVAEPRQPSLLSMAGFLAITLVIGLIVVTRGGGLQPASAQAPAPTYAPAPSPASTTAQIPLPMLVGSPAWQAETRAVVKELVANLLRLADEAN